VLKPGQKIGKYKLKARLANGPYATVFRALDTLEGVNVALKIPHKGLVTKESLDDFSREVRLAAKLDHPNIVKVFHVGQHEGRPFFTMELMVGGNLERALKRAENEARHLGRRCDQLEFATCDAAPEDLG